MAGTIHEDREYSDTGAEATRCIAVDAAGNVIAVSPVVRTTTVTRYANAGPAGVTPPGTLNIPAGRKSYSIAVITAASAASPTLDGVALTAGTVVTFTAPPGDTLEAAAFVTVSGDDALVTQVA